MQINESLTNDVVSFEQLGPDLFWTKSKVILNIHIFYGSTLFRL